jgi:glucosamine kinase
MTGAPVVYSSVMSNADAPLLVAVDGGGSRCRVRIEDRAGHVLGEATGGPANVATDAKGAGGDIACLALAGTEAGIDREALNAGLRFSQLIVTSDLDATVTGALGGADGSVAGLGTGSFFVVQSGGRRRRMGGWGFALSDECSGALLGREALRRAVAARDGLAEASGFTEALLAEFTDMRAMIGFAKQATPEDYGRYARELVAAQDAGDPVAQEIMAAAVDRLCAILDRLGAQQAGRLCLVGGLGPAYRRLLPAPYAALCVDPAGSALDGAMALARAALPDNP